jgi:hypothetical protein
MDSNLTIPELPWTLAVLTLEAPKAAGMLRVNGDSVGTAASDSIKNRLTREFTTQTK